MSQWYLYGPKMPDAERDAFIAKLEPLDALEHLRNAAPAPVYLQFGTKDFHVPKDRADRIVNVTSDPKRIDWYEAGHGLNADAVRDRMVWIKRQWKLQ
jgi:hypothetical protein